MTQQEAEQLVRQIRRTRGWLVVQVGETPFVRRDNTDYRIRLFHMPTRTEQWVYDPENWDALRAKFGPHA